jgi:hypothetical protein
MHRSLPLCLALSAVALSALACSDSNSPAVRPRSYQLVSYGGVLLPVTLRTIVETSAVPGGATTTCDDRLTGSTLVLLWASRFTETDSHLLVCDDARPDAASQEVLQGTYSAAADTLVLNADLGSGMSYIGLARVSNGGLTIYSRRAVEVGGASTTDPTLLVFRDGTD